MPVDTSPRNRSAYIGSLRDSQVAHENPPHAHSFLPKPKMRPWRAPATKPAHPNRTPNSLPNNNLRARGKPSPFAIWLESAPSEAHFKPIWNPFRHAGRSAQPRAELRQRAWRAACTTSPRLSADELGGVVRIMDSPSAVTYSHQWGYTVFVWRVEVVHGCALESAEPRRAWRRIDVTPAGRVFEGTVRSNR